MHAGTDEQSHGLLLCPTYRGRRYGRLGGGVLTLGVDNTFLLGLLRWRPLLTRPTYRLCERKYKLYIRPTYNLTGY